MICVKFIEIGQVVLKKSMKMWKVFDDICNGDDRQKIGKAHIKLLIRWAKNRHYLMNKDLWARQWSQSINNTELSSSVVFVYSVHMYSCPDPENFAMGVCVCKKLFF